MGKLTGPVSFLMQAILVVAAVLIFSFFDPFGIFGSRKQTLRDTPITVSSIKEIGQFISAEYYGEVLSSLNETCMESIDSNVNELQSLDSNFAEAIADLRQNDSVKLKNKRKVFDYFHEHYPQITGHRYYRYYIEYLGEKFHTNRENKLLDKFYEEGYKISFNREMLSHLKKSTAELFAANKKSLKKQIVLLGRGSVKAGFDFEKFNSENFRYVSDNIYLVGIKPEILSCSINPWFIPEKKIKGFELVLYTGKANDPQLMNEVKEDCLQKLRQAAMNRNILGKATENARENLKIFFSLILDHPVNNVIFVDDTLAIYENEILRDGVVRGEELASVDSLLSEMGNNKDDSLRIAEFIDTLKRVPFIFRDATSKLTCYSSAAFRITADWTVDSIEYSYLKDLKAGKYDSTLFAGYWVDPKDTFLNKDPFKIVIEDIKKNTNQLIVNQNERLSAQNQGKARIDSKLDELK